MTVQECWQWFNHGSSGQHSGLRHEDDSRDYGFVLARCLSGFAPMLVGLIGLLEVYPASSLYNNGVLWTNPVVVALFTSIASIFMFLTPLIGEKGPDPGWADQPARINYSLSHMIDNRWMMFVMSTAWVYPASLLWATEYRTDWLQGKARPGGLVEFLCQRGAILAPLWSGTWLQCVRRISLLLWQLAFMGFLMITDSTKWVAHTGMVNTFALALFVHVLSILVDPSRKENSGITAQLCIFVSASLGLLVFIVLNTQAHLPCLRKGVGYWYWFVEVWALSSVIWFMPARLFCDEQAPTVAFGAVSLTGLAVSLVLGALPLFCFRHISFYSRGK